MNPSFTCHISAGASPIVLEEASVLRNDVKNPWGFFMNSAAWIKPTWVGVTTGVKQKKIGDFMELIDLFEVIAGLIIVENSIPTGETLRPN
jgi:hypothetical protein